MKAPGKGWMLFILFSFLMAMAVGAYVSGTFTFEMLIDFIERHHEHAE